MGTNYYVYISQHFKNQTNHFRTLLDITNLNIILSLLFQLGGPKTTGFSQRFPKTTEFYDWWNLDKFWTSGNLKT